MTYFGVNNSAATELEYGDWIRLSAVNIDTSNAAQEWVIEWVSYVPETGTLIKTGMMLFGLVGFAML